MAVFDIDNYHRVFKQFPECLMESRGRVYGIWMIGNFYKRKIGYHGEYPPSFLKRIHALFPERKKVLHLFSGTLTDYPGASTIDLNPEYNPTVVGNVLDVSEHFPKEKFSLIIADPPYSKKDATIYGVSLVNKRLVLREVRKVVEPDGILVWLDTGVPIFRKIDWNLIGMVGVFCGTNRTFRVVTIFQASTGAQNEEPRGRLKKFNIQNQ
jgi:hypothetical protein